MITAALSAAVSGSAAERAPAGSRITELRVATGRGVGFTLMPSAQTGVAFTNLLGEERSLTNQIYHNGSGVAVGDVDGDGLCDIYLGNIDGPNALYRNLDNWKFTEVAAASGVAYPDLDTTGVLFADVDGDGDLDLIVNAIGRGTLVFLNDGRSHFRDATVAAGTAARTGSVSAALADVDGDGDLDLYITNYRTVTLRDEPFTRFKIQMVDGKPTLIAVNDRPVTSPDLIGRFTVDEQGGIVEHGEPDVLFRNEGAGKFSAVSWTNGAFLGHDRERFTVPYEYGLSVMMRDLNGDSAPDIYVCNDFYSEDRLWLNRGDGTFQLIPRLALRQTSVFSMGVDVADIDRDGHDDIFVVDMLSREHTRRMVQLGDRKANVLRPGVFDDRPQYMRNTLFWNRGDGTYAEVAQFAGLEATEWSWTPIFLDVDLDGYEDLLISNGHLRDAQNVDYVRRVEAMKKERRMSAVEQLRLRKIYPKLDNRNFAFRNRGDLRFDDMSAAWGFDQAGVKQGMALADLDNDGDLDVVINSLNGPALVYRNDATAPRLAVRLKGQAPNTSGVGAKIRVLGGPVPQSQEMICGGRFLSGDDFLRVFAAGSATNQLTIEVTWRSGKRSVVREARGNRLYEIAEDGAVTVADPKTNVLKSTPWFSDASMLLRHTQHESEFNDFERQPLLSRKLSQPGPGVSWFDVDGDGAEELLIGSGRGGELAAFQRGRDGGFARIRTAPFDAIARGEQTAILGQATARGRVVLAGTSHYEEARRDGPIAQIYNLNATNRVADLPSQESATGPLALGDVDGDGELDLFVGGRVIPGRYPEAASSLLFRGAKGQWIADAANTKTLEQVGLVTSAVFSDLDGDGAPELVLACEWGPLHIFRNDRGKLVPWNPSLTGTASDFPAPTLSQLTGWWNSVAAGDFDGDGRMDLVAGNWGENTGYRTTAREPLRIYFGDFNDDGVFDLLEGRFDSALKKIVPLRDPSAVARALPHLASRFANYEAYGQASIMDVIGTKPGLHELSIHTLQSVVLLNRGTNFEIKALPREAQLSPVFGLGVADFDGDGREDLLLAQNFFAVEPMTSRYDGGRGALLQGKGDGSFRATPAAESGIAVYGEGRGVAVCDYDGDGRVDACIGQNGAATKLYHNEKAQPGLRVRLQGGGENLNAIGAVVRPLFVSGKTGAAREIHAGSGWLSQDSAVPVLAAPEKIESLWVRWPGGSMTTSSIPSGASEVSLDSAGKILRRK